MHPDNFNDQAVEEESDVESIKQEHVVAAAATIAAATATASVPLFHHIAYATTSQVTYLSILNK